MERATLISGGGKLKDNWDSGNNLKFDKDYPYDYPWPPRYYTCSFCQREFKSAQALGGHMNIHRRDRARLRDQSPPTNDPISDQNPNPNFNLNPNPNPSSQQPLSFSHPFQTSNNNIYAHQYSLVSLSLSTLPKSNGEKPGPIFGSSDDRFGGGDDQDRVRKWRYISTTSSFEDEHHEVKFLKSGSSNGEIVRLDLELCLGEAKEDLDLELRLGI